MGIAVHSVDGNIAGTCPVREFAARLLDAFPERQATRPLPSSALAAPPQFWGRRRPVTPSGAVTDGTEADLSAGDAYRPEPGHDASGVGDEPVVALEFASETAQTYDKG